MHGMRTECIVIQSRANSWSLTGWENT